MADERLPRVMLVGDHNHFESIAAELRDNECEVVRFRSGAEFDKEAAPYLPHTDVICAVGSLCVGDEALDQSGCLRALISPYAGIEGFDRPAATAHGVIIANGNVRDGTISMAEAAIMLILASLYDLPGREQHLRSNAPGMPPLGEMLYGKTIGLVGFGRIARAIVDRLLPWGVRFQTYSPRYATSSATIAAVDLDTLLASSDVICVVSALNDETRHLLDAERLRKIRPGATIVNVARGAIIDEAALVREAQAGRFSRLALDVFETEPLPTDSPLRTIPNAILTPHAIGHTRGVAPQIPSGACATILSVLDGRPPSHVCNPEVLPVWLNRWAAVPQPEKNGADT